MFISREEYEHLCMENDKMEMDVKNLEGIVRDLSDIIKYQNEKADGISDGVGKIQIDGETYDAYVENTVQNYGIEKTRSIQGCSYKKQYIEKQITIKATKIIN